MLGILLWQVLPALATTYYVDSANGKDSNKGTTKGSPWQSLGKVNSTSFHPGDKVLFRGGSSWKGQLNLQGSGKESAPIRLDRYDAGPKPVINAAGVRAAVSLNNEQYWEINNLEIINNSTKAGSGRCGIRISADEDKAFKHIYIRNCAVHEVDGAGQNGMTGILAVFPRGSFSDLRVESCTISQVDGTGILIQGNRRSTNSTASVRNNMVFECSASGIVLSYCAVGTSASYNTVHDTCYGQTESRLGSGAITVAHSDQVLLESNECYHNSNPYGKGGQGFEIAEGSSATTIQYNYSHDNGSGFLSNLGYDQTGKVRYNISQNDGSRIFHSEGRIEPAFEVYNNVFYLGANSTTLILETDFGATFRNNIIYSLGAADYAPGVGLWEGNCFYGNHPATEPPDARKLTSDPHFLTAGGAGIGRNTCSAYQLSAASPCIDAGTAIADNGGRDFFGNRLYQGDPDIGAHEYLGRRARGRR